MTQIVILDRNREKCGEIDRIFSLTWVERFSEAGQFELHLPLDTPYKEYLILDNYLMIPESYFVMVIYDINPKEDQEESNKLILKGKTTEDLLNMRIIYSPFLVNPNVQSSIIQLLEENFISPTNTNRTLDFINYQLDPILATTEFESAVNLYETGTSVYSIIKEICTVLSLGFRLFLIQYESLNAFMFKLYLGVDRSHLQSDRPRVIFSRAYENLISASLYKSSDGYKNIILVLTDDVVEDLQKNEIYILDEEPEGQDRREISLSIPSPRTITDGPVLTDLETETIITRVGIDELHRYRTVSVFEGEFDIQNGPFKYGPDFYLGDITTCVIGNENFPAKVIERIFSRTEGGVTDHVVFDFDYESWIGLG